MLGTIRGLAERDKGFSAVITNALVSGVNIGPPAESEYAVDPFDVDIIRPSALFDIQNFYLSPPQIP